MNGVVDNGIYDEESHIKFHKGILPNIELPDFSTGHNKKKWKYFLIRPLA
jgi:hypothetical protein